MSKLHEEVTNLLDERGIDAWGTALDVHFAIANVLHAMGERVPKSWGYRPGAISGRRTLVEVANDAYSEGMLAQAVLDGDLSRGDLVYAGNVLSRYGKLLKLAGKDY